jgi:hypothetical protein
MTWRKPPEPLREFDSRADDIRYDFFDPNKHGIIVCLLSRELQPIANLT